MCAQSLYILPWAWRLLALGVHDLYTLLAAMYCTNIVKNITYYILVLRKMQSKETILDYMMSKLS